MNTDRDLEKYRSRSQQRVLQVMLTLAGHEVDGLHASEIARALKISPPNVHRDLANLALAGIAEQIPGSGTWRLTPRVPKIAVAMLRELESNERKLGEIRQRYTRDPR